MTYMIGSSELHHLVVVDSLLHNITLFQTLLDIDSRDWFRPWRDGRCLSVQRLASPSQIPW